MFPEYKQISTKRQPMNYNKNWSKFEKEIDEGDKDWGNQVKA